MLGKIGDFIDKNIVPIYIILGIYCVDFVGDKINAVRNSNIYYSQPKYNSVEEIKRDLEIEKKKLGLENLNIGLNIYEGEGIASITHDYSTDSYVININFSKGSRAALRHELCHVKNKFNDRDTYNLPIVRRFKEWNATSCSLEE